MNQPRTILVAALAGFAMTVASASVAALSGTASVQAGSADRVAERIAVAFAAAPVTQAHPAIQAAAARTNKGDLLVPPPCAGQRWPDIAPGCLVAADGTAIRPIRTVTVGYRSGEASSVLIRMPAPQVASR